MFEANLMLCFTILILQGTLSLGMEGVESKSQSQWQDSQIMPENSIRVTENVEGKILKKEA